MVCLNCWRQHFKLLPVEQFKKSAKATGDFINNKITDRITEVSRNLSQNNPETVTNEHDKEIQYLKEIYIYIYINIYIYIYIYYVYVYIYIYYVYVYIYIYICTYT